MSHHDINCNESNNEHFQTVLEKGLQSGHRRNMLRGFVGLTGAAAIPVMGGCGSSDDVVAAELPAPVPKLASLDFGALSKSIQDQVQVPAGYSVRVLHATGDPLSASVAAYSNNGTETDDWAGRVGDHHDGMEFFYIGTDGKYSAVATSRAVLAVNHESSADAHFFHAKGQTSGGVNGKKFNQFGGWDGRTRPSLEVLKEINHHGVSIVEVTLNATGVPTGYSLSSTLNRRVTPQTVVDVKGPASAIASIRNKMVTKFDANGATARGTLNNCGTGNTPWGTVLTCEENWAFYFNMPPASSAPDAASVTSRRRYGVASAAIAATAATTISQGWYTPTDAPDTEFRFSRWNIAASGATGADDFRNEPNTFGYNVEIDPLNPSSRPAKRTAMGRFAHEAAVNSIPESGKPLAFYMGCDSRNEYIYKFVSTANWDPADIGGGIAAGDKYLNEGKLFVAKFNSDGTGQWLELNTTNAAISSYAPFKFNDLGDVLVHTRLAADAVGATKMDRPEWGAVNPVNGEVYMTLTNNSATNRNPATADGANPRSFNDTDGTRGSGNPNGHIIRFKEEGGSSAAVKFAWDIFLFGSEEDAAASINISKLTEKNSFSSPDGLWFSKSTGICWIQTDDGAFTDETNCMLLAAIPGAVGDGGAQTINNSLTAASGTVATGTTPTFVGAVLGDARLKRFLVAPPGAEVTGMAETADGKTIFVNIQHPGEDTPAIGTAANFTLGSTWPGNAGGITAAYGPTGRPRSATLIITKNDGGRIGS